MAAVLWFDYFCLARSCAAFSRRAVKASAGSSIAATVCSIGQGPVPWRLTICAVSVRYDTRMPLACKTASPLWLSTSACTSATRICTYSSAAALPTILSAVVLGEVNWIAVLSASVLAGILSILTSVAGLPEVKGAKEE